MENQPVGYESPMDAIESFISLSETYSVEWGLIAEEFDIRGAIETMVIGFRQSASLNQTAADAIRDGADLNLIGSLSACAWAIFEAEKGNVSGAWSGVLDANFYYGLAVGTAEGKMPVGNSASLLANQLHDRTTRKERVNVVNYWRENIDPNISAQKAATKIEAAGVTKLSHKKIAEIISPLRKAELLRRG